MGHYVVCVDSVWARNAEIFDMEGLPDDALADMGLLYDESPYSFSIIYNRK